MYRCEDCGHLFEEGEKASWIEPHSEELYGCPICKGDYVEVEPCKICGEYIERIYDGYCKECTGDILKRFKAFLDDFSEEERELLILVYDEVLK